jgi:uncharacterized RDD family membrane protein YckC
MAMATTATSEKAGFWIRFIAIFVDGIILGIISNVVGNLIFQGEPIRSNGLSTLLGLVYYVYFWSAAGEGRTPGMRIFNLKVVKTDGSMLTYAGAFIRYVGLIISCLVFLIGVIWVAFDPNKQGWHDKIAGTYVIRSS